MPHTAQQQVTPHRLRILMIDDHAVVRNGIKLLFENHFAGAAFGEASSGPEAIKLVHEQDWDVAVLDITLGEHSGIGVLKELKEVRPTLPVLILSMHAEAQYARRAFKAGASGYITKDSLPDELAHAINRVATGGKYVSSSLAEYLVSDVAGDVKREPHERLTDREFEILLLIASGKTVSQIADQLSRSVKTISTYRARILEKMSMRTNAELTYYVIKNNLLE